MSEMGIILILYAAGVITLVLDIFIPSHGVLTLGSLALLFYAVVRSFMISETVGWIGLSSCAVVLPTIAYVGIKNWYRTPFGKRIAPNNPTLTSADIGVDVERLSALVGRTGVAVTSLRPVGVCDFDGHRVSCVANVGLIDAGSPVRGESVSVGSLVVASVSM